ALGPGAFFHEHGNRRLVAQPVTGGHRVGKVTRGTVVRAHRGGDAPLRVPGIPLAPTALREDKDVARAAQRRRRAKRRDAAADDQVIAVQIHALADPVILPSSNEAPPQTNEWRGGASLLESAAAVAAAAKPWLHGELDTSFIFTPCKHG